MYFPHLQLISLLMEAILKCSNPHTHFKNRNILPNLQCICCSYGYKTKQKVLLDLETQCQRCFSWLHVSMCEMCRATTQQSRFLLCFLKVAVHKLLQTGTKVISNFCLHTKSKKFSQTFQHTGTCCCHVLVGHVCAHMNVLPQIFWLNTRCYWHHFMPV